MNDDTQQVVLWITNDSNYFHDAHAIALNDPMGTRIKTLVCRLVRSGLDFHDRLVSSLDDRHTLSTIFEQINLDNVDWKVVRDELAEFT